VAFPATCLLHFATSTADKLVPGLLQSFIIFPITHGPSHLAGFKAAPEIGPKAKTAAPSDPPIHMAYTNLVALLSTAKAKTINTNVKVPIISTPKALKTPACGLTVGNPSPP